MTFPAFDVQSILTKGYACGLGTTGYQSNALLTKGYLCEPPPAPDVRRSRGHSPGRRRKIAMRDDDEILALLEAYFSVRDRF